VYYNYSKNLKIKGTEGNLYEQLPFLYRLKSYALFINGKN